jgi:sensor c-di-GMP phosphodiesterase-like protein
MRVNPNFTRLPHVDRPSFGAVVSYPSVTRLKVAAAVLGIVMAGAPIILFNAWLSKQGDDEAAVASGWALASAETRLRQTTSALQELAARGVDSCKPAHVDAMRHAALLTGPIKQIMQIAASGEVLCTDTGGNAARLEVLASAATADAGIALDVIRLADRSDRLLRLRKAPQPGRPGLAALVPAGLLLPQASAQGAQPLGSARIAMSDGTPVAVSDGAPDPAKQGAHYSHTRRSKQYPLAVSVSMPRSAVVASDDDLRRIGMVTTGGIALIILVFALLIARRDPTDPMADMARAIRDNEFVPYYQPLVDLQSGRLLGAEVLVRWRRPDGSFVEPNAFVLLLEWNRAGWCSNSPPS